MLLLELPTGELDTLLEEAAAQLNPRDFAHFALTSRVCATAAARALSVVVPMEVAQRLQAGRHAGKLACAMCPDMVLPDGLESIGCAAFELRRPHLDQCAGLSYLYWCESSGGLHGPRLHHSLRWSHLHW